MSDFLPTRRTDLVSRARQLAEGVFTLSVRDPYLASHAQAGQFANLFLGDQTRILPRPMGIAQIEGDEVSFIFAVVGEGTRQLAELRVGDSIDVLGPLGQGFKLRAGVHYLLVGGGLGIPPLISAAQAIQSVDGARSTALCGYRDTHFADDIMGPLADRCLSIDESEGNVIDLLNRWAAEQVGQTGQAGQTNLTVSAAQSTQAAEPIQAEQTPATYEILSCGPDPMMKAVAVWASQHKINSQFALEARMGCGFGTCFACVVPTVNGLQRVCLEGPVFAADELTWQTEA